MHVAIKILISSFFLRENSVLTDDSISKLHVNSFTAFAVG